MLLDDFMNSQFLFLLSVRYDYFRSYVYAVFSTVATNGVSIGVSIAITNPGGAGYGGH